MGFSLPGLLVGLAVLLPNILLLRFPPATGIPTLRALPLVLTMLERAGQVGCLALVTFSGAGDPDRWLAAALLCVAAYWALWARYLVRGRQFTALFAPLGWLPIPMAVFPVAAFASAAVWAQSGWLALGVGALSIGHLTNSWLIYRSL